MLAASSTLTKGSTAYSIKVTLTVESNDGIAYIHVALPLTYENVQTVSNLSINPGPRKYVSDLYGNKHAYFPCNKAETKTIIMVFNVTEYAIEYQINSSNVGSYDRQSSLYKLCTMDEKYIETKKSLIVATSRQIAAGETNPYLTAKKFCDYVHSNMTYVKQSVELGAVVTLQKKEGMCEDFSDLFCALCRAQGIPAIPMVGLTYKNEFESRNCTYEETMHQWAQFYLPSYGWIPADPTWGNSNTQLGKTDMAHIILTTGHYNYKLQSYGPYCFAVFGHTYKAGYTVFIHKVSSTWEGGGIPGFPWEGMAIGITLGVLAIIFQRKTPAHSRLTKRPGTMKTRNIRTL